MSHVDFIIVVLEGASEGQTVVISTALFLDVVLVVVNIFAITVPPDARAAGRVGLLFRVDQGLLTLIE